jgi:predicted nucleotidyltransferase component of viral defense system
MKLHQNSKLFRDAINYTAQQLNIPPIYIEKDYWVTYALFEIFNQKTGEYTVFKGGTALSKCFNVIERFSEDIDLVIIRDQEETDNQLKKKIKAVTSVVNSIMPETPVAGITNKMGMIRKTGHSYSKLFQGDFGQVRDVIIIEATWLGYYEPYTTSNINSLIYNMMKNSNQHSIAKDYNMLPFKVQVLESKRTICEKIMSLVRFSYTKNPIDDLRNKVRHIYDLHQLLKQEDLYTFFTSTSFDNMLIKVAQDDVASFKNNNLWLENHPTNALFFSNINEIWDKISPSYFNVFSKLVYGNLPTEYEILESLSFIKERIQKVDWNIQINK